MATTRRSPANTQRPSLPGFETDCCPDQPGDLDGWSLDHLQAEFTAIPPEVIVRYIGTLRTRVGQTTGRRSTPADGPGGGRSDDRPAAPVPIDPTAWAVLATFAQPNAGVLTITEVVRRCTKRRGRRWHRETISNRIALLVDCKLLRSKKAGRMGWIITPAGLEAVRLASR